MKIHMDRQMDMPLTSNGTLQTDWKTHPTKYSQPPKTKLAFWIPAKWVFFIQDCCSMFPSPRHLLWFSFSMRCTTFTFTFVLVCLAQFSNFSEGNRHAFSCSMHSWTERWYWGSWIAGQTFFCPGAWCMHWLQAPHDALPVPAQRGRRAKERRNWTYELYLWLQ